MRIHESKQTYPAKLKTMDDRLLEIGAARISAEDGYVDFVSDFVQLFRMNTPLKIVLVKDDVEIQRFTGKSYLSAQDLLRLVDVEDEILPGAKIAYLCEVDLDANVSAQVMPPPREHFTFLPRRPSRTPETFPVKVHGINMRELHFSTRQEIVTGKLIRLDMRNPPIDNAFLDIIQSYEFGQEYNIYHCKIANLDPETRTALNEYIEGLCYDQLKVFGRADETAETEDLSDNAPAETVVPDGEGAPLDQPVPPDPEDSLDVQA